MASIPKPLYRFPNHYISTRPKPFQFPLSLRNPKGLRVVRFDPHRLRWNWGRSSWSLSIRVSGASCDPNDEGSDDGARALQGLIEALPPVKRNMRSKFAIGLYIIFAFLAIIMRQIMLKKQNHSREGSVADLVKRGHLRSDRRGISKPLKYEDPFNNPLVKVHKNDSTVEVCGKVYRLAPVTLTEEQQSAHQKRRLRAYQWTRPKVFLKEGDTVPPDVDPDSVKWIPSNHPFATTATDIDEDVAQNNVFQKHGVPSRVRAEHEALQKKLRDLENDQGLNGVTANPYGSQDIERLVESPKPRDPQRYGHKASASNPEVGSADNTGMPSGEKRKL